MKEIRPAGNTPGASPQSDVVRVGCAKGDIKGLWQEGESVPPSKNKGSLPYSSVTRDHSQPQSRGVTYIDEKSRTEF